MDRFVGLEQARKAKQQQVDDFNRQANEVSKSIGKAKDAAERETRKEEGRRLRELCVTPRRPSSIRSPPNRMRFCG